jgi:conjugal transfer pilus assembly protein TraK
MNPLQTTIPARVSSFILKRHLCHVMATVLIHVAVVPMAMAQQFIDADDTSLLLGKISVKDNTRIKVENDKITRLIGRDLYDEKQNPDGKVMAFINPNGEAYLGSENQRTPFNVFVITEKSSYNVLLTPLDIPGDTLVLRDRQATRKALAANQTTQSGDVAGRSPSHLRTLKTLMLAMLNGQAEAGMSWKDLNQPILLWQGTDFILQRQLIGRNEVGEVFKLTNTSTQLMTLTEQEFYTDGVLAITLDQALLQPRESTLIYIIRGRNDNE